MKKLLLGSATVLIAATTAMPAYSQDVSVSTSIDYVSEYVFRGVKLGDQSIQPGVEVAVGDFTVGGWFSTGIGENSLLSADEFDLYAGYSLAVSESLGLDVGLTYYHYPQTGSFLATDDGAAGTYEVYAGLSFDAPLAPSATAYYDLTLDAFTLEGGVGHSFDVAEKTTFDLGATVGLVDVDGGSYEYGSASAGISYAFTDDVSIYGNANYGVSSEDTFYDVDIDLAQIQNLIAGGTLPVGTTIDDVVDGSVSDNSFWVGVGIAAGF